HDSASHLPHCLSTFFVFSFYAPHRPLHSFPTRRSSDLVSIARSLHPRGRWQSGVGRTRGTPDRNWDSARWPADTPAPPPSSSSRDRKSTRLNSSHQIISYAVFCLKKKKTHIKTQVLQ